MYLLQLILEIDSNFMLESSTPYQVMAGKKATPRPTPTHSELMINVSHILAKKMEMVSLKQPQIPYIINTTARRTKNIDMIKNDLIYGVSKPVYWYDSISILYELDTRQFLEISQGNVLTEIGKKSYEDANWKKSSL
jgi:malonyl CoA-acyl carrier protein transacylase